MGKFKEILFLRSPRGALATQENSRLWAWSPSRLDGTSLTVDAIALGKESDSKLASLPLGDFGQTAFVFPLARLYNDLSFSIYEYLETYREVQRSIPKFLVSLAEYGADPFVAKAVENAIQCATKTEYSELLLDPRFIIEPVQRLLNAPTPVSHKQKQLIILHSRFRKQYLSEDSTWNIEFDTSENELLGIKPHKIPVYAEAKTIIDASLFNSLTAEDIISITNLKDLNLRCDALTRQVQEYMDVGVNPELIDQLAQEFRNRRNFFSFTSVLNGVALSRLKTETLSQWATLIDSYEQYKGYRDFVRPDLGRPALHSLVPYVTFCKHWQTQRAPHSPVDKQAMRGWNSISEGVLNDIEKVVCSYQEYKRTLLKAQTVDG